MAVRPIDGNELYRIEKLLDTDIVRQDKVALNLLEQVLYDIQHVPPLTPPNEPLTLDQLRVRWKGCDSCKAACWNCSHNLLCRASNDEKCHNCFDQSRWEYNNYRDYCPDCGRPLTDEAWVELERRLRG